jgi:energy-coupling factor transporter transmembrane protein EcfT
MRPKRIWVGLYFCCVALLLALLVFPIRSGLVRLLIVFSGAVVLFGAFVWIRTLRLRFALAGVLILIILAIALLPGKQGNPTELRTEFVRALRRYKGNRYIWGGENGRGVDCSGIVRTAWIDAQLRSGIKTANPRLLRNAVSAWWHDASAKELSLGYSGRTRELHAAKSIRANEDARLLPGDFAIVARGVHALAYLGEHTWIEADPGLGKVIVIQTSDPNSWLDSSAVFVRWRDLDERENR